MDSRRGAHHPGERASCGKDAHVRAAPIDTDEARQAPSAPVPASPHLLFPRSPPVAYLLMWRVTPLAGARGGRLARLAERRNCRLLGCNAPAAADARGARQDRWGQGALVPARGACMMARLPPRCHASLIADGVGPAAGREVASQTGSDARH